MEIRPCGGDDNEAVVRLFSVDGTHETALPTHQYAVGGPVYLSVSPLCNEQSGGEQSSVGEQLSGDAGHHCLPLLRHRALLAFQVPKQVSGGGTGRDKTSKRGTEEDAKP